MSRLLLPILLLAVAINAQSEEFLRLKKELEDRIAALRPEAREVAQKLQAVFEARLPKDEAKARLNAVLENASEAAKAALETLKPDRKIDPEIVIKLPDEPADFTQAELLLDKLTIPGLGRITAAVERANLTDKTLTEAFANPNLATQLGIDKNALVKIQNLANERGLGNNTVDNVLHTLRYNLSLLLNGDERSCLEKLAYARNATTIEELFSARFLGQRPLPPPIDRLRNATDNLVDDFFGGRNRSGEFIDHIFNGTDRAWVEKIKQRFGNDSTALEKFWSNATGEADLFGNRSEKAIGRLLDSLKSGNFSVIDRLFNGTDSGALAKIVDAFKTGNFAAISGTGAGGKDGSGFLDNVKAMFNATGSGGGSNSANGTALANFGASLATTFKNFFTQ